MVTEPDWVRHAIWWHVYPLGFVGAQPERAASGTPIQHRLTRLTPWLDYLIELGASGLLLGPIFESATHGYDTVDYRSIDRRLGDEDDFAQLVSQCRARGIRIMLDGVFNHVGRDFPMFAEALAGGPRSPAARWFRFHWDVEGSGDGAGTEPEYEHFEGHRALVTLNHDAAEVVEHVVQVMCHWLERGADGWRLDAAYAVPPSFWAAVLPRVRERFPEAYFVGEVIHGDYAAIVQESGMDSATDYELWKSTWSSLNDNNFHELAWTMTRHDALLETFVPLTFVGNHDVTRIATRLTDERHVGHAAAVLFTLSGTPCVYAGDEQGFRGTKYDREGGDAEVRPPFPDDPADLHPLGRPTFEVYRELIGVRRRHPWLHRARAEVVQVTNDHLVYVLHEDGAAGRILLALNVSDDPASFPAPHVAHVLAGHGDLAGAGEAASVVVPGHGWAVLE